MELYSPGDAIEGASCSLFTRKPEIISTLVKYPLTGKSCMRVEMSRNASAEISKAMVLSESDKLLRNGVHLEVGDKLKAESISVFVAQRRPVSFSVKEGATHTHGGHFCSTGNNTFCKIKYAYDHIQHILNNKLITQKKQIEK